jgi:glyoxylase-like metal-dependent hydrolase (beta-lactamase superfamily II)
VTDVRRLIPLTVGWQELDRSVALDGYPPGTTDRIPIPAWLIERTGGSLILYDTGFDPTADAEELAFPGFPPPEVIALPDAIAAAGYDIADVGDVVLSHCMVDHAGGLRCLRPGTRVWVQLREWTYATGPDADPNAYRAADFADLSINLTAFDGDAEPWPGVHLIATPGHCPGHQSLLVELAEGWVAVAADAADLQRNITERVAPGILLDGRERALASLDRFIAEAQQVGAVVVPGHDPDVWALLPAAFGASTRGDDSCG